jgi:predicted alpha/beta hydrolase
MCELIVVSPWSNVCRPAIVRTAGKVDFVMTDGIVYRDFTLRKANKMNQRVLLTAGASGIGREIARAFAANGGRAFVADIDAKGLDSLSKETEEETRLWRQDWANNLSGPGN